MKGRVVGGKHLETLPFVLPLPVAARVSLIRSGLVLRRALRRQRVAARRAGAEGLDEDENIAAWKGDVGLDSISMGQLLGPMHADVARLMRAAANRAGGELETMSAGYGAEVTVGGWNQRRANIQTGTERLVDGLVLGLQNRIRVSVPVFLVEQDMDRVIIHAGTPASPQRFIARACIVAVPPPNALRIMPKLPQSKEQALRALGHAAYVVLGCFTERGAAPWDDVYAVACPETSFQMFFNPGNAVTHGESQRAAVDGSVVVYAAGDRAVDLLDAPDVLIERTFLKDLARVFPGHPSVRETVVQRWPYGCPTQGPGRAAIQEALGATVGRIAFAGDYIILPSLGSAIRTGRSAARQVRRILNPLDS
jgi:protoporphyrinogen oxidase